MHNNEESASVHELYFIPPTPTRVDKAFVNPWPKAVVRERGYWLMVTWSIIGLCFSWCLFIYGALLVVGAMAFAVFALLLGLCEMGFYTFC